MSNYFVRKVEGGTQTVAPQNEPLLPGKSSSYVLFLLLLDPETQVYELLRVVCLNGKGRHQHRRVRELIKLARQKATVPLLAQQEYESICRLEQYCKSNGCDASLLCYPKSAKLVSKRRKREDDKNKLSCVHVQNYEVFVAINEDWETSSVLYSARLIAQRLHQQEQQQQRKHSYNQHTVIPMWKFSLSCAVVTTRKERDIKKKDLSSRSESSSSTPKASSHHSVIIPMSQIVEEDEEESISSTSTLYFDAIMEQPQERELSRKVCDISQPTMEEDMDDLATQVTTETDESLWTPTLSALSGQQVKIEVDPKLWQDGRWTPPPSIDGVSLSDFFLHHHSKRMSHGQNVTIRSSPVGVPSSTLLVI